MEEEHVPVVPNIFTNNRKQKKNIFENIKDPDIQHVLKKNVGVLEMNAQKTNEEQSVKSDDSWLSYILIGLIIVVVILVISITYYFLIKNSSPKEPVPSNVVKPGTQRQTADYSQQQPPQQQQPSQAQYQQYPQPQYPQQQQSQPPPQTRPRSNQPLQPSQQTQPSKKELNDTLRAIENAYKSKLETIDETKELEDMHDHDDDVRSEFVQDLDDLEDSDGLDELLDDHQTMSNLILSEENEENYSNLDYVDLQEIDEFHNQVINDDD